MKDKKIGIITFHKADNLGAVLQAYALQEKVKEISNSNVEIIDYDNGSFNEKVIVDSLKNLLKRFYYKIKNNSFNRFRKRNLNLSKKQYQKNNIMEANDEYDIFICGSDQIWNLSCSGNDYNYFLEFVNKDKLKYSYAASVGTYEFNKSEKEKLLNILNSYNKISIREKNSLKNFEFLGKDIQIVPDPVFLLSKAEWEEITPKRIIKEKYILVYLIQEDVNVIKNAEEYAKKYNLKIISNKRSAEFILHNSPKYFLSWIKYAECIFTNSFHGTAFSLILQKNFKADIELRNGNINNRINDLLIGINAKENIIGKEKECQDYALIDGKVKELRNIGTEYITEILKG